MDCAGGGFSEKRLDLRERQLNWIEVGAVGRQEKHARAGGLNGFANGSGFVGWQVVQDDGVAGHERWGQDLLDISEEGGTVHGPIDGHGRHHAIKCQAANKGRRLPMAIREPGARQRSPLGARPYFLAILVDVPLSSIKTRRAGSRSGWALNQA